jgi:hypothetical protein
VALLNLTLPNKALINLTLPNKALFNPGERRDRRDRGKEGLRLVRGDVDFGRIGQMFARN